MMPMAGYRKVPSSPVDESFTTDRRIRFQEIELLHIAEDCIFECWGEWYGVDLPRQLNSSTQADFRQHPDTRNTADVQSSHPRIGGPVLSSSKHILKAQIMMTPKPIE